MWNFYDFAYWTGLSLSAPYWSLRQSSRRKVTTAFDQRMGYDLQQRVGDAPCIMIHAVSVGEINATRSLVQKLREANPKIQFVISTTTELAREWRAQFVSASWTIRYRFVRC